MSFAPEDFFDLSTFRHRSVFEGCTRVWEVLSRIGPYLREHARPAVEGEVEPGAHLFGDVAVGPGSIVRSSPEPRSRPFSSSRRASPRPPGRARRGVS